MPTILSLPYETLGHICDELSEVDMGPPSLAPLSLTCRAFRHPAQAALFHWQFFDKPSDVAQRARLFKQTPRLAIAVRHVDLTEPPDSASAWLKDVVELLDAACRVTDVVIRFDSATKDGRDDAALHSFWMALRRLPLTRLSCDGLAWPELSDGLVGFAPLCEAVFGLAEANVPLDKQPLASHEPITAKWLELKNPGRLPAPVVSRFNGVRFLVVNDDFAQAIMSGRECKGAFVALVGLRLAWGLDRRWFQLAPNLRYVDIWVGLLANLADADLHALGRVELLGLHEAYVDSYPTLADEKRAMRNLGKVASSGSLRAVFFSQLCPPEPEDVVRVERALRSTPYVRLLWDSELPTVDNIEAILDGRL